MMLDTRQRAMLAEMGVKLWARPGEQTPAPKAAPEAAPVAPPPAPATPAFAAPAPLDEPAASPIALAPRPEGVEAMDWPALQATVAQCRACGLCEGRTQTVFGVGSRQADWMVVGEAPGENEDRQGQPFVGQAGQLLDAMLAALRLSRHAGEGGGSETPAADMRSVYIANVLKCRPPANRNPQPDEVTACEPYLRRQVALLRPRIILAMGRFAVQSLLQTTEPIGRLRGRVHHYEGVPVIVTYHPAYLLRALPEKAKAWADLCLALQTAEQGEASNKE
ncbi:MAG: uracil-DNA glycosylase [Pseudomonadota bacterium]|nr:uracil-DNA glycosylase [Pseudomonadota bacterium]